MALKLVELTVDTSPAAVDAIADALRASGASGVVEERRGRRARVTSYWPLDDNLDRYVDRVRTRVRRLRRYGVPVGAATIRLREVDARAWSEAWKSHFKLLTLHPRLIVRPSWEPYSPGRGQAVVTLDPGLAFGTGTHPTTQLCLLALVEHARPGHRVVDVGSGSGILAIAALKLGAGRALAVDDDPTAVEVTRLNAALNRVASRLTARRGHLLDGVRTTADIIVANILAPTIVAMAPVVPRRLRPGGIFIGSGFLTDRVSAVRQALERAGLRCLDGPRQEEWAAVIAVRPPMRRRGNA